MAGVILAIRTDQPAAELYLLDSAANVSAQEVWQADRQLSQELLAKISHLLKAHKLKLPDLEGVVVFRGPGSFTGLRIGVAVANALAYGLGVRVVGTTGSNWLAAGVKDLAHAKPGSWVVPEYGAAPNISKPRK